MSRVYELKFHGTVYMESDTLSDASRRFLAAIESLDLACMIDSIDFKIR